jgi:protein-tyrosine phosphatase
VIDLHCHVLPGIDDGPATMEEAIALGRAQEMLGVRTIVATPHVSYEWPEVTAALIAEGVAEVNAAFAERGIAVQVIAGAEVALTRAGDLSDDELTALRLGSGPWLLLEPPFSPAGSTGAHAAIVGLMHRGHRLVLAHPERSPLFLRDRALLEQLVASGALCSVTAGALVGRFGRDVQRFALGLMADGLVHDIASDAHGSGLRRPPGVGGPVDDAGYGELRDWLCSGVPGAIIAGEPLPPRPAATAPPPRPRGLARLLRRA